MTPEKLSYLAGAVIGILLGWFPGLKQKYDQLNGPQKAGVAAGFTVAVGLVIFGLACIPLPFNLPYACNAQGFVELATVVLAALSGLATAYVTLVRGFKK